MKRGYNARLEKASDYFYFKGGEATDWIDRTVPVPNVSALTLEQWMEEFRRLKKFNAEIVRTDSGGKGRRGLPPSASTMPLASWQTLGLTQFYEFGQLLQQCNLCLIGSHRRQCADLSVRHLT